MQDLNGFLLSLAMLLSKGDLLQIRGGEIMPLNQKVIEDQKTFPLVWRAEHTGQVLSAMGEGSTVASKCLLGIRFQESHRGKTSFLVFWGKSIKQYVVCWVLASEYLKLKAAYVKETSDHFSSIVGYSCALC